MLSMEIKVGSQVIALIIVIATIVYNCWDNAGNPTDTGSSYNHPDNMAHVWGKHMVKVQDGTLFHFFKYR